jgi:hypothetical protein
MPMRDLLACRPPGFRHDAEKISAELARRGYLNQLGNPFGPASIKSMLEKKE